MERATGHPVRALLLELHVILDDANDVSLSFEIVDECLGVKHPSVLNRVVLWLLSQLNEGCTSSALIGWGSYETCDVWMISQQARNRAP